MTDAQAALARVGEALAAGPTPGPWRWEVSAHSKRLQLVGGLRPQYDLTVMGFARWGMSGATIKLRDLARDGLDLLYKLHERADWTAPIPGREHHANWCSTVTHPDAAFIAKCNPENIAAILAHVEAQAAEIERYRKEDEIKANANKALLAENERLTAALQHEADCVEAAKAEIERLTDENRRLRADLLAGRNVVNAGLTIHTLTIERDMLRQEIERLTAALQYEQHRAGRQGTHGDGCADWGPEHYECAIRERDELRRQLAEAKQDARRYRDWLRGGANIPPESTRWARWEVRHWDGRYWNTLFAEALDTSIDAAMDLTRPAEES